MNERISIQATRHILNDNLPCGDRMYDYLKSSYMWGYKHCSTFSIDNAKGGGCERENEIVIWGLECDFRSSR